MRILFRSPMKKEECNVRSVKIIKDNKGVALGNAVLFMMIVFALCTLIMTVAVIGHGQTKIESAIFQRDVEIDQIGEDFLESVKSGVTLDERYEKYEYNATLGTLTVWRKNDAGRTTVLYVEAELVYGEVNVKVWRYSN